MNFTFHKEERLIHRKDFEKLLQNGQVQFTYPFRVVWLSSPTEETHPVKVAFAVPKKKYKRANKRNLIRRRMREAFRLNKHPLYTFLLNNKIKLSLLFVYIGNEIVSYHDIEKKTIVVFNQIMENIRKNT